MSSRGFWKLAGVSDEVLVGELKELVSRSAWTEARVVAHLAELEARGIHLTSGRSLFRYCQECLGLSQNEAFYRIQAARMGRQFPVIFELLEQRRVHLTAVALIRDFITEDNHVELLREVSGKTKEQILVLLASRAPRPDVVSRIRRLPTGRLQRAERSLAAGPTGRLEPLSAATYRLQLSTSASLKDKLELAADLMSHANPSRDLAVVIERALDLLLERLQNQRFGQTKRARKPHLGPELPLAARDERHERKAEAPHERKSERPHEREGERLHERKGERLHEREGELPHEPRRQRRATISRAVLRALVERDGLGCTFVGSDGRCCGERAFLQVHHERAWAKGGADSSDNLRLVCAAHNRLLAEREFGREHVQRAVEHDREARGRKAS